MDNKNENLYKESMKEIALPENLEAVIVNSLKSIRKEKKCNYNKLYIAVASIIIITVCIFQVSLYLKNNNSFTITAFAGVTNNSIVVAKERTELKIDTDYSLNSRYFSKIVTDPNKGAEYTTGEVLNGTVNLNIYFKCEGDKISSVTYTSKDINFFESKIIPLEIATNSEYQKNNNVYFVSKKTEGECLVNYYIGKSYTVSYVEQTDKQYGMIIPALWSINNEYDDILWEKGKIYITAIVTFEDGSEIEKIIEITQKDTNAGKKNLYIKEK